MRVLSTHVNPLSDVFRDAGFNGGRNEDVASLKHQVLAGVWLCARETNNRLLLLQKPSKNVDMTCKLNPLWQWCVWKLHQTGEVRVKLGRLTYR